MSTVGVLGGGGGGNQGTVPTDTMEPRSMAASSIETVTEELPIDLATAPGQFFLTEGVASRPKWGT